MSNSERLERVRYETEVAKGNYDKRRNIDDPLRIFEGLEDGVKWHRHGIITIKDSNLFLGNHHHDFNEVYFAPNGGFDVWLTDAINPVEGVYHHMVPGSRLLIPMYVDHRVRGDKRSVLDTYGSVPYDIGGTIDSDEKALRILDEMSSLQKT